MDSSGLAGLYRRTHRITSMNMDEFEPSGIESDPFLDAFFAIDTDGSETITADELAEYARKNNFQEGLPKKWLRMFDTDGDGEISLAEFCEVLGLEPKNARSYRRESIMKATEMPDDIQVIDASMPEEMRLSIVQAALLGLLQTKNLHELAAAIKEQLDEKFGQFWHVMLVAGRHCASYSHEPDRCFVFKAKDTVFCIWKTPAE